MEIVKWVVNHWAEILAAVNALLLGLIAVCLLIPGPQPEGFLQKIVDIIAKFSKK